MSAYIDLEYLLGAITQRELRELTSDDGKALTEADVTRKIEAASDEADTYLRGRYALPLSEVPATLKIIVRDITVYRLYSNRPTAEPPKIVADLYAAATRKLEKIAGSDLLLFEPPSGEVSEVSTPIIGTKTEDDQNITTAVLDAAFPLTARRRYR